jgi:hypothetical protein
MHTLAGTYLSNASLVLSEFSNILAPVRLNIPRVFVGLYAHESILRNLDVITARKEEK